MPMDFDSSVYSEFCCAMDPVGACSIGRHRRYAPFRGTVDRVASSVFPQTRTCDAVDRHDIGRSHDTDGIFDSESIRRSFATGSQFSMVGDTCIACYGFVCVVRADIRSSGRSLGQTLFRTKAARLIPRNVISVGMVAWSRNHHRLRMGKRLLGQLLVVGSKGNAGIGHFPCICVAAPSGCRIHKISPAFPYLYANCHIDGGGHIFRSESVHIAPCIQLRLCNLRRAFIN